MEKWFDDVVDSLFERIDSKTLKLDSKTENVEILY